MIEATYRIEDLEHRDSPPPKCFRWPRSGYGRRLPLGQEVKLPGGKRWRRVYYCIFSNIGTSYVESRNRDPETGRPNWIVIY